MTCSFPMPLNASASLAKLVSSSNHASQHNGQTSMKGTCEQEGETRREDESKFSLRIKDCGQGVRAMGK